ncbi:PTS mannitol transporter subunit IIA [Salmonella enterica subsp. diarizonae]|uniref:PTS mannitol transporter subunit IIA n=7 Tax=Salmonella enterica TaxID=28901 RepID=A0A2I5HMC6_SALDZ|nr:PTS sugar transporter subunit IIA [Salmonella enterica]AXC67661.1 PTS mannitol transporter subunit IIA [Salmonella enterica subsp. diarizonae serovar 59:z10:-]EAA7928614.1 PTS mannitol transporter subunit IIA [Salmonella enterica subsp. enterica serovar Redlands]EBE3718015.1 PTS mannitol transporter subunit IIA [Salmonella enterica subsp. diarizonae serovar 42:l,v:1,5,7]EBH8034604.1 PTS mannitol transporter subunit IIA [Salmonella bongori]EBH9875272.1 PTS mannitol transporter subunit IIA [S
MNNIFTPDNIILNAQAKDKFDAIRITGNILKENGYVTDEYIKRMIVREEIVSTYLGNGLAIPHGTDGSDCEIIKTGISLVQFPDGVDFGDGNTAYITIGIAGKEAEHMDLLNKIALICIEEDNVQTLRNATSIEQVLQVLNM